MNSKRCVFSLVLIFVFSILCANFIMAAIPNDCVGSTVSYWKFDEDYADKLPFIYKTYNEQPTL